MEEDIKEFKDYLDGEYGSIEIEGKVFKASEILEVFDKWRFDKAFNGYLILKDNGGV